jgi:hypothetical protein
VRTRDSEHLAGPGWIAAADVAAIVLELAAHGRTDDPSTRTSGPIVRMRPRVANEDAQT